MRARDKSLQKMADEQGKHKEMHKARVRSKYVHAHQTNRKVAGEKMKDFYNNLMK